MELIQNGQLVVAGTFIMREVGVMPLRHKDII